MEFFKLVFGFFSNLLGGGLGKQMITELRLAHKDKLNATTEIARIDAAERIKYWEGQISQYNAANREVTERQKFKMNVPVFVALLVFAFMPGLSTWLLLTVYNVLWWPEGIWPQTWKIAAYPPPYDQFVIMSMQWLFDPIQFASSTATAALGGLITGKRT